MKKKCMKIDLHLCTLVNTMRRFFLFENCIPESDLFRLRIIFKNNRPETTFDKCARTMRDLNRNIIQYLRVKENIIVTESNEDECDYSVYLPMSDNFEYKFSPVPFFSQYQDKSAFVLRKDVGIEYDSDIQTINFHYKLP